MWRIFIIEYTNKYRFSKYFKLASFRLADCTISQVRLSVLAFPKDRNLKPANNPFDKDLNYIAIFKKKKNKVQNTRYIFKNLAGFIYHLITF